MADVFLHNLNDNPVFPSVNKAWSDPDGLLAWGGELNNATLIKAYRQGIFPWCSPDEPLLWWCPSQRMVLQFEHLRISQSLKKHLKKIIRQPFGPLQIRIDTAFENVIHACSTQKRSGQSGTWIAEDFIRAYTQLHYHGYAHSVETWYENKLVGGLYGVSIGKMFYGESMFSHQTDASKTALIFLMHYLARQQVFLIDCQQETPHLTRLGGACIPREDFCTHLNQVCEQADIHWEAGLLHPEILIEKP